MTKRGNIQCIPKHYYVIRYVFKLKDSAVASVNYSIVAALCTLGISNRMRYHFSCHARISALSTSKYCWGYSCWNMDAVIKKKQISLGLPAGTTGYADHVDRHHAATYTLEDNSFLNCKYFTYWLHLCFHVYPGWENISPFTLAF